MRRLGLILTTLSMVSFVTADVAQACRLFGSTTNRCCRRCCVRICVPPACEPSAPACCEPADESVGTRTLAAPAESGEPAETDQASEVPAPEPPEVPVEAAREEPAPPAEEPAESEEETAMAEDEPAPAEAAAPAEEQVEGEPADEAAAMAEFFGESAKQPAEAEKPAPAEAPAEEAPASEKGAGMTDEEKAMAEFFGESAKEPEAAKEPEPDDSSAVEKGFRIWADRSGKHRLEARYVATFKDGTVRLEKTNHRWVRLSLAELSPADQLLARQLVAAE